jgi:hypothetical protein
MYILHCMSANSNSKLNYQITFAANITLHIVLGKFGFAKIGCFISSPKALI